MSAVYDSDDFYLVDAALAAVGVCFVKDEVGSFDENALDGRMSA